MIIAVIVLGPVSEQDGIRYLSLYSITISVIVDLIVSIVLMCRVMVSSIEKWNITSLIPTFFLSEVVTYSNLLL
jgi:hypothetical protein